MGGVPTSVTATEAYNAMESGVVDTVAFAPHAHLAFRTIDQASWWTDNLNPGTVNCPVVVNIDAYNALSDDERAALDGSVEEAIAYYIDFYNNATMTKWEKTLADKAITQVHFPEEELAKFREAAAGPARDAWIAKMDAAGIPGQELYDLVMSTLAAAKASN